MNEKHTPTPWKVNADGTRILVDNGDDSFSYIANLGTGDFLRPDSQQANAAFIVRAANAHEALVEVLKEAITVWPYNETSSLLTAMKKALALAEGGGK